MTRVGRSPIDRDQRAAKRDARLRQSRQKIANRSYEKVAARIASRLNTAFGVLTMLSMIYEFVNQDIPAIVRDTLRAIGLDWRDDDPLSRDGLAQVISRMTGVHFSDVLDPVAVRADIVADIGARIEEATGYRPTSFEPTEFRDGFLQHVTAQIKSVGGVGPIASIARQAQHVAWDAKRLHQTFAEEGWERHLRRWNWRKGSKNFSISNKQRWRLRALWKREWDPAAGKFGKWKHLASKRDVWFWWKRNQIRYHYAIEEGPASKALTHRNYVPEDYPITTQYAPTNRLRSMPRTPTRRRR